MSPPPRISMSSRVVRTKPLPPRAASDLSSLKRDKRGRLKELFVDIAAGLQRDVPEDGIPLRSPLGYVDNPSASAPAVLPFRRFLLLSPSRHGFQFPSATRGRRPSKKLLDKLKFVRIMMSGPMSWKVVDESKILKFPTNRPMQRTFINYSVTG